MGQLGLGDVVLRATPTLLTHFSESYIMQASFGQRHCIAYGARENVFFLIFCTRTLQLFVFVESVEMHVQRAKVVVGGGKLLGTDLSGSVLERDNLWNWSSISSPPKKIFSPPKSALA